MEDFAHMNIDDFAADFGPQQFIDTHCHCLAGLDDGPRTMSESVSMCRMLVRDGIKSVVATPHQLGRYTDQNCSAKVRESVIRLREELQANNIDLKVYPGGESRIDERLPQFIQNDDVLTVADNGKYILLELPNEIFIDIGVLLAELNSQNVRAIIAHPERHPIIAKQPNVMDKWFEYGCCLQITAGSILGQFGNTAQKASMEMLKVGWVGIVAGDCHDTKRRKSCMTNAFRHISLALGQGTAKQLCIENPSLILQGRNISCVGGLSVRGYKDGSNGTY